MHIYLYVMIAQAWDGKVKFSALWKGISLDKTPKWNPSDGRVFLLVLQKKVFMEQSWTSQQRAAAAKVRMVRLLRHGFVSHHIIDNHYREFVHVLYCSREKLLRVELMCNVYLFACCFLLRVVLLLFCCCLDRCGSVDRPPWSSTLSSESCIWEENIVAGTGWVGWNFRSPYFLWPQ